MITKLKDKFIRFFCWIWKECKDVKTFILLMIVSTVVYSPVWGGYLLSALFGWEWASVMASACLVFWAGPFTPFFPICIGITLAIKRRTERRAGQQDVSAEEKPEKQITYAKLFWLFIVGSVAGVIIEGLFCLIAKGHWETHVVSVIVPYNLLYGLGAVLFYIGAVKLQHRPIAVQIIIMTVFATVLELICGLLLRYGLGMRAWNYSHNFMNYKGIICLSFSAVWGIAAFVFAKMAPRIESMLDRCTGKPWLAVCTVILSIVIALDLCMTGTSIIRWSERHYGIPAQSSIQKELDVEAPDDWMQKRFVEWRFLDLK